jgi:hypothetical protein
MIEVTIMITPVIAMDTSVNNTRLRNIAWSNNPSKTESDFDISRAYGTRSLYKVYFRREFLVGRDGYNCLIIWTFTRSSLYRSTASVQRSRSCYRVCCHSFVCDVVYWDIFNSFCFELIQKRVTKVDNSTGINNLIR